LTEADTNKENLLTTKSHRRKRVTLRKVNGKYDIWEPRSFLQSTVFEFTDSGWRLHASRETIPV
jgi:hypothetical protein